MENRRAELQQAEPRNAAGDDSARFLRELRQLRGGAGLGHAELAARAHYPCDAIRAAEAGPSLPDLPVLSAYVRGCGGPLAEWEERWRHLTRSPALPLLPVRPAGTSDAATAGARVGSTSLAADGHDPHVIMAALGRVADGMAATAQAGSPAAGASGSKPATATAPAAVPMAAAAAGPEAAAARVAPGTGVTRGASVAPGAGATRGAIVAPRAAAPAPAPAPARAPAGAPAPAPAPAAGPAAGAASGSGAASRAAAPSAVPALPASGQAAADRRHMVPPRTMATALSVALVVGVIATLVVVVVAVLALFA